MSVEEKQLDRIEMLLSQILAVELYLNGCTMKDIGKHLHIAKSTVVKMLKGVKRKNNAED